MHIKNKIRSSCVNLFTMCLAKFQSSSYKSSIYISIIFHVLLFILLIGFASNNKQDFHTGNNIYIQKIKINNNNKEKTVVNAVLVEYKKPKPKLKPKPKPKLKPKPKPKPKPKLKIKPKPKPKPKPKIKPKPKPILKNKIMANKVANKTANKSASSSKSSEAKKAADLKAKTLTEKFIGLIQNKIHMNWINQFNDDYSYITTLRIFLADNGNVKSVIVLKSSGNNIFDRQAVLAVEKSSPLPLPEDKSLRKKFLQLILPFRND